ncbi:LRR receptor-like serine/threonine-protein kinase GSO1 [Hevea brasiliensis]|uniref:LRR receptor-like serine/threonine-protein kinase GSO1 n=1 Tax=Hevea brasiliensis TaxID=3981 RepID=UPI0025FB1B2C|nr:LRR receptor-like serine/threonine-protein kinase GSO1 [Hevea brasiliensis]
MAEIYTGCYIAFAAFVQKLKEILDLPKVAQEYGSEGIVSTKGDVYSFGILLMETFTGKKPTDDMFGGRMSLKEYIKEASPDAVVKIADANLLRGEENFVDKKDYISFILGLAVECCEVPDERIGVPSSLCNISTLTTLWLKNDNPEGNVPEEIGKLANLETLILYGNKQISGSVPWTIFNISSLRMIDLSFNRLSGSLPDDICQNLLNLRRLVLHHNQLEGQIPLGLWKCSLDNNKFFGNIRTSIGNLAFLQQLYLSFNNLTGKN